MCFKIIKGGILNEEKINSSRVKEEQDLFIVGPSSAEPDMLSNLLNEKGFETDTYQTNTWPTESQIDTAVAKAKSADRKMTGIITYSLIEKWK